MIEPLRFAIVGCGRIAQRHTEHIAGKGKLVAVCDIVTEKADILASAHQTKAWYGIEEMLANEKNIDVVVICTPNGLHAQHSIQSLQAGFHVLCEKPMAINTSDCKAMIAAAGKAGKQLFIVKPGKG
jgi:UDP-N-acetyl-2-amino-2-deoxyglucuronate dehydrogenase